MPSPLSLKEAEKLKLCSEVNKVVLPQEVVLSQVVVLSQEVVLPQEVVLSQVVVLPQEVAAVDSRLSRMSSG
jgi:hypothetical protein